MATLPVPLCHANWQGQAEQEHMCNQLQMFLDMSPAPKHGASRLCPAYQLCAPLSCTAMSKGFCEI